MKQPRQRRTRATPPEAASAPRAPVAPLQHFGTAEVTRLVGISTNALRSLVRERHVSPERGPGGALRFTFQDLIALRTARALSAAGLPTRRITRALRELRRHLPAQVPLSGLSIRAGGEHVIVREAGAEWEGGSGQYLLSLEVTVDRRGLRLSEPAETTLSAPRALAPAATPVEAAPPAAPAQPARPAPSAADSTADVELLFCDALDSEDGDAASAISLYRRCLRADPRHVEARINLARLLHASGDIAAAERLYLHVSCRADAVAQFNLAVLLEDQGRLPEAIERYLAALALDPQLADAHYNLARLYDLQGNAPHTIRHLRAFQRLAPHAPE
ncbi:MAG TPA: tetratricopeptide repeat protein [Steroidobacteraceae bacterium]|nr:tetratricopeptide repeat protein [Steroidobacteraceae bacterium]